MSLLQQNILGIKVTSSPKNKVLEELEKYLFSSGAYRKTAIQNAQKPFIIVTPNPEQLVLACQETWFAGMLNRADVALPDGIGVLWASWVLRGRQETKPVSRISERIPGVEFMQDLARICADRGVRIGLIGSRSGLAEKALECLTEANPKLTGWSEDGPELTDQGNGVFEGPEELYWRTLVVRMRKIGVRVIFVGLGAPKQEYFISRVASLWEKEGGGPLVLMSVGGSFDILAGRLKRAPLLIRSIGFEWLWRLFQEPWRWRRQMALLEFIRLVIAAKSRQ